MNRVVCKNKKIKCAYKVCGKKERLFLKKIIDI